MVKKYIPQQGDLVLVDLNPTKGHEQKGYRPAAVLSNNYFNQYTKMVVVCPISSNEKEFPTHYILKDAKNIKGAVLCEHVRSIDYNARNLKFVEKLSDKDFVSILTLFDACIEE